MGKRKGGKSSTIDKVKFSNTPANKRQRAEKQEKQEKFFAARNAILKELSLGKADARRELKKRLANDS